MATHTPSPCSALPRSAFAELVQPYAVFENPQQTMLAVANCIFTQHPGRHIDLDMHGVHLYSRDGLTCVAAIGDLKFPVNALAWHPHEPVIAISIGRYDGGAVFEGDLLIWNYQCNVTRWPLSGREVLACAFDNDGSRLHITIAPEDDLDDPDPLCRSFSVAFPLHAPIDLRTVERSAIAGQRRWSIPANDPGKAVAALQMAAHEVEQDYENRDLIWDMCFIDRQRLALARGDSCVDIWDMANGTVQTVRVGGDGQCVQVFHMPEMNALLVNLHVRNTRNMELHVVSLDHDGVRLLMPCRHILSRNRRGFFLARQVDWQHDTAEDFVLDDRLQTCWHGRLGHYDLFNHHLRIDGHEPLYYVHGTSGRYMGKTLYALEPETGVSRSVAQLEAPGEHLYNLNAILLDGCLYLNSKTYQSQTDRYGTQRLTCIRMQDRTVVWRTTVSAQITAFAQMHGGTILITALADGGIEIYATPAGERLHRFAACADNPLSRPLSLAVHADLLAVGMTDGDVRIYRIGPDGRVIGE